MTYLTLYKRLQKYEKVTKKIAKRIPLVEQMHEENSNDHIS